MSVRDFSGKVRDFNGADQWSAKAIVHRYREYSQRLGRTSFRNLVPRTHTEGDVTWVYPVMEDVIAGAEDGDPACIAICIEFIEEDQSFPFGAILKSNSARALRRAHLSSEQMERVRARVVRMLLAGYVPHEFKEYAKLLRRVGVGAWWPIIEQQVPRKNPGAMRYYRYFRAHALPKVADSEAR
jgi:hypothetical protein